ncbi:MAG: energy-coupling factor transporter transmembrane protein EcfT [Chloroflexi bacterium]|nr:energy-coupling factor transporter transmembrane protein EcfT [Chloroflexota bacterium]
MKQHPLAWVAWVCGAAVCSLLTRNPLYQVILTLSAWLVLVVAGGSSPLSGGWMGVVRLGALIWVITIPFNALMLHQGNTVLFSLPANWPLVGGNITLEAVIYGASAGLAIWVLLLLFSALNTAMDASELIRLAPPVFYQAGIITSIGLTFVPQMVKSSQEIREAQRVRGHHFRSWRDLLPLVIPLLTTSLERAMELAESMEARGFGGETNDLSTRRRLYLSLLILLGLGLLLTGAALGLWLQQGAWWTGMILICAVGCLAYAFTALAQHSKRSHYSRRRWTWNDTLISAGSLAALSVMIVVRVTDNLALTYYPFPPNALLPAFNPWVGLALVLYALPGLVSILREPFSRPEPMREPEAEP